MHSPLRVLVAAILVICLSGVAPYTAANIAIAQGAETPQATSTLTTTPDPSFTVEPTGEPTDSVAETPTAVESIVAPTEIPSAEPTLAPTEIPPTGEPTVAPTDLPPETPTDEPTVETPTPEPTLETATPEPTVEMPTPEPTLETATPEPTGMSTDMPTETAEPTQEPSPTPNVEPTLTETPLPIPTVFESPTLTATPEPGTVQGKVRLQGNDSSAGISITADSGEIDSPESISLDGEHSFRLNLPPGTYILTAARRGYLSARRAAVQITSSEAVRLPVLTLTAGDANNDGAVDIADAALVAGQFDSVESGEADLNGDGVVNVLDLVLVNTNFGKIGVQEW